ncbi:uncharacterized protein LOC111430908 isoform X1 [Cucurbita moschata]|uniref:Uncharacterized protein LOC111430908 isoform X1 n=1 Tax=Cucurbita moschata TaxID=3662 RepID=A0A6J1E8T8_CUCMO|nr:uncharacterized protein LOC111430908 isoform X1 [Cucurbita moschata]
MLSYFFRFSWEFICFLLDWWEPLKIREEFREELRSRMASSWKRSLGNVRSLIGNSMGGLRGGANLASWVVAGTLAYFLWVKPSQDLKREQQERAALAAADPHRYIEKRKPIPDPQETGSIYGNKNTPRKPEE